MGGLTIPGFDDEQNDTGLSIPGFDEGPQAQAPDKTFSQRLAGLGSDIAGGLAGAGRFLEDRIPLFSQALGVIGAPKTAIDFYANASPLNPENANRTVGESLRQALISPETAGDLAGAALTPLPSAGEAADSPLRSKIESVLHGATKFVTDIGLDPVTWITFLNLGKLKGAASLTSPLARAGKAAVGGAFTLGAGTAAAEASNQALAEYARTGKLSPQSISALTQAGLLTVAAGAGAKHTADLAGDARAALLRSVNDPLFVPGGGRPVPEPVYKGPTPEEAELFRANPYHDSPQLDTPGGVPTPDVTSADRTFRVKVGEGIDLGPVSEIGEKLRPSSSSLGLRPISEPGAYTNPLGLSDPELILAEDSGIHRLDSGAISRGDFAPAAPASHDVAFRDVLGRIRSVDSLDPVIQAAGQESPTAALNREVLGHNDSVPVGSAPSLMPDLVRAIKRQASRAENSAERLNKANPDRYVVVQTPEEYTPVRHGGYVRSDLVKASGSESIGSPVSVDVPVLVDTWAPLIDAIKSGVLRRVPIEPVRPLVTPGGDSIPLRPTYGELEQFLADLTTPSTEGPAGSGGPTPLEVRKPAPGPVEDLIAIASDQARLPELEAQLQRAGLDPTTPIGEPHFPGQPPVETQPSPVPGWSAATEGFLEQPKGDPRAVADLQVNAARGQVPDVWNGNVPRNPADLDSLTHGQLNELGPEGVDQIGSGPLYEDRTPVQPSPEPGLFEPGPPRIGGATHAEIDSARKLESDVFDASPFLVDERGNALRPVNERSIAQNADRFLKEILRPVSDEQLKAYRLWLKSPDPAAQVEVGYRAGAVAAADAIKGSLPEPIFKAPGLNNLFKPQTADRVRRIGNSFVAAIGHARGIFGFDYSEPFRQGRGAALHSPRLFARAWMKGAQAGFDALLNPRTQPKAEAIFNEMLSDPAYPAFRAFNGLTRDFSVKTRHTAIQGLQTENTPVALFERAARNPEELTGPAKFLFGGKGPVGKVGRTLVAIPGNASQVMNAAWGDLMRFAIFKEYYDSAIKAGHDAPVVPENFVFDPSLPKTGPRGASLRVALQSANGPEAYDYFSAAADAANVLTGYGSISASKWLGGNFHPEHSSLVKQIAGGVITTFGGAPRYRSARFTANNPAYWYKLAQAGRGLEGALNPGYQVAKSTALTHAAEIAVPLALTATALGVLTNSQVDTQIGTDPLRSNFGKFIFRGKKGDFHLDIFNGLGSSIRFGAQELAGGRRTQTGRDVYFNDPNQKNSESRLDHTIRYLRSQVTPGISPLITGLSGRTPEGDPFTGDYPELLPDLVTPLILSDTYKAAEGEGAVPAAIVAGVQALGLGDIAYYAPLLQAFVQTYNRQPRDRAELDQFTRALEAKAWSQNILAENARKINQAQARIGGKQIRY